MDTHAGRQDRQTATNTEPTYSYETHLNQVVFLLFGLELSYLNVNVGNYVQSSAWVVNSYCADRKIMLWNPKV
jgi:hypothetical protein